MVRCARQSGFGSLRVPFTIDVSAVWGSGDWNGSSTGPIPSLILPDLRAVTEVYEPDVWRHLMAKVRPGDVIADVGGFIGFYAIALGRRVGPNGRVVVFEPDSHNCATIRAHIRLNQHRVSAEETAAGNNDGQTWFTMDKGIQNQIAREGEPGVHPVSMVRIDSRFKDQSLGLLKIDVEGFEDEVLKGAGQLLNDPQRAPRLIYIEVHPYNWHLCGMTNESLMRRLQGHGYVIEHPDGTLVTRIEKYGEIVARMNSSKAHEARQT